MEEPLKNLENYLSVIKKDIPDIEQRLNAGADEKQLEKIAKKARCQLPAEFIELYKRYDGEDSSKCVHFFAGMDFLSLDEMSSELDFFKTVDDEMTAIGTKVIREMPVHQLKWIPIATCGPRAWLIVDLSPAENGSVGQIITMDYETNDCYLLAKSLDELFEKMTAWFQEGIFTVDMEDPERPDIMEESGETIFERIEDLAVFDKSDDNPEIALPEGFWQWYYEKLSVPLSCLEKETDMILSYNRQTTDVDCTLLSYMKNLKKLIIYDVRLINIGALAKVPQLKELELNGCTFAGETLSALAEAPNLKALRMCMMSADGLVGLCNNKSLKSLDLIELSDIKLEELGAFTGLQELRITGMELHSGEFIEKMKNLKKLDLQNHVLDNLDFLKNLKKLTAFHLSESAKNEDGLLAVRNLIKLKEFLYPVKDLSVYKGHQTLKEVGIAVSVRNGFEIFEGSKVNGFRIFGSATEQQMKKVMEQTADQMRKYVQITSYGGEYTGQHT
ncbi:MAG: SMI1/KNR4 family protein [Lachnospiraceae bacterium]|nr:SMI1/KNR4 family protein [Lachnospiraceae bacterium]